MANTLRFKRGLVAGIPTAALGEPLFTTDTFDLYIGNGTGNTRFQKYIASGTTSQLLRGDGSLLTMPIVLTSPSNGQVLKYDGTNWVNSSDAGVTGSGAAGQVTYWGSSSTITGSNNLFWDATNNRLGIGLSTPTTKLELFFTGNDGLRIRNSGNTGSDFAVLDFVQASVQKAVFYTNNDNFTFNVPSGQFVGQTGGSQRFRINSSGNFIINNPSTDNGLRFQVTGDGYFSGAVGIGQTSLTGSNFRISKTLTGSASAINFYIDSVIQSDVTNSPKIIATTLSTQAAAFTIPIISHFYANQGSIGAGSAITTQIGFQADNTLTGATNNFGFYGNIASGTGRWNLYMNGTAANYLAGNLWIGTTSGNHPLEVASAGNTILYIRAGATSLSRLVFGTSTNTDRGFIDYDNTAASRNMSFKIAETERMRLDASGNLGLGVTPSAWSAGQAAIQGSGWAITQTGVNNTYYIQNANFNGTNWIYRNSFAASFYLQQAGSHQFWYAPVGTAGNVVSWTQGMTLFSTGNFTVGNNVDAGFRLDVNGTMRVSGALTVASTGYTQAVFNGTNTSDWGNHIGFQAQGTVFGYVGSVGSLLGNTTKDMTIWSTAGNGFRVYTNGNNLRLQIDSAGAATFSSSVTAASFNGTTNNIFSTGGTERMRLDASGNLAVGIATASSRLHVDAAAGAAHIRISEAGTTRGFVGGANGIVTSRNGYFMVRGEAGLILSGNGNNSDIIINPTTANVQIGGTSDTGEKLQVTGTMRVSGASTLSGGVTLGHTAGVAVTFPGGQAFRSNGGIFIDYGNGGTGDLVFRRGAGVTNTLTLAVADGAATFSSSVNVGTNLTVDTNTFFVDATNNRVGIGTLVPDATFRVAGAINSTQAIFGNVDGRGLAISTSIIGGTNEAGVVLNARSSVTSGTFIFQTDGTQRVQIDSTGLIINGGNALEFINSAANAVSAIRPTSGGTSVMSTNSNGLHIAVGTEAAGDLILASNNTERVRLSSNGWFSHTSATNPSSSVTDSYVQYSADVTAGNAAPHFRTENGAVIKLYQETTGVGNAIFSQGGGNSVLDDSTFDGYTLRQIVKALRNQGILA